MIPQTLPTTAQPIAADTWLIPTLAAEPSGTYFAAHSLIIRGREPVIVDTGCSLVRDAWLQQAFSVVEPADVRWIFLSHDDHDHVGNISAVLELCPNATLVCSFSIVARLFGDIDLPLERMRWIDAGQSFDVGDRTLTAVRPPMFDSPATRGLYDNSTRLLWAVDSFATFFPGEVYDAADIPADLYDQTFAALNSWNTPWLEWVDAERYARHVHSTASLSADVVASAHGPVHRGEQIEQAYRRTLELARQPVPPTPGQEVLDHLVSTLFSSPGWAVVEPSSRVGKVKWSRVNEIVSADAPDELVWRTVHTRWFPDSTEWRIRLEPDGDRTRIVQTFDVLKLNPVMDRLIYLVTPAHRDRLPALADDLRRLAQVATKSAGVSADEPA